MSEFRTLNFEPEWKKYTRSKQVLSSPSNWRIHSGAKNGSVIACNKQLNQFVHVWHCRKTMAILLVWIVTDEYFECGAKDCIECDTWLYKSYFFMQIWELCEYSSLLIHLLIYSHMHDNKNIHCLRCDMHTVYSAWTSMYAYHSGSIEYGKYWTLFDYYSVCGYSSFCMLDIRVAKVT